MEGNREKVIWVDGEFMSPDRVNLTPFDLGVAVGMGVFDSLCGYDSVPFDFSKHYARLCDGSWKIGLEIPAEEKLFEALQQVAVRNGFATGKSRLRISVLECENGSRVVVSASGVPNRAALSNCVLSPYRVNENSPLAGIKSTSYAMNMLALREAEKAGADEAIFLNTEEELCEGATSNIFVLKDGVVKTSPLSSGCLPGVARDTVLEICEELKLRYKEVKMGENDLLSCEEAFLTSSLREVQPIESIDGKKLPIVESSIVRSIQAAYKQRYESYKLHG